MANEKNIIQKVSEIAVLANNVLIAVQALEAHPSLKEVKDFASMLEAFANGQPKPQAKAGTVRTRRTKAEIEAEKLTKVEAK